MFSLSRKKERRGKMTIKDSDRRVIDLFITRKQYDRAIELLERLYKQSPNELTIKQKLADAYYLYGLSRKAIPLLIEVAETYARAGFITKAMAVQMKILKIDPKSKIDIYKYVKEGEAEEEAAAELVVETPEEIARKSAFRILDKLFAGLSKAEFGDVFKYMEERTFKSDELIVEEGTESDAMYIINTGSVRVWTKHKNKQVELAVLREGNFFGEVALLTGAKRTASITAIDECHLLQLTHENFLKLNERYPNLRKTVEKAMEQRAYSTIESLLSFDNE
jgi:tetratricopeptide (TPR) repeat protein